MNSEDIKNISIIGSGTMGSGIAICSAKAGYKTILYDIKDEILVRAKKQIEKSLNKSLEKKKITEEELKKTLDNLIFTSEFNDVSKSELVIEAALEDLNLKKDIFSNLDSICAPDTILATNTSSLSVTTISTYVKKNPGRVAGMHFFNPADIMKLVEIVKGDFTSPDTIRLIENISRKMGKIPVSAGDTPAFIVNRIARPFYGEALRMLSEGTAEVQLIDKVMKNCGGFAMGPFELMDLIGIDVNFSVTKSVFEAFFYDSKYRPSYIQKKMVDANLLGRKTKRGFYTYE